MRLVASICKQLHQHEKPIPVRWGDQWSQLSRWPWGGGVIKTGSISVLLPACNKCSNLKCAWEHGIANFPSPHHFFLLFWVKLEVMPGETLSRLSYIHNTSHHARPQNITLTAQTYGFLIVSCLPVWGSSLPSLTTMRLKRQIACSCCMFVTSSRVHGVSCY